MHSGMHRHLSLFYAVVSAKPHCTVPVFSVVIAFVCALPAFAQSGDKMLATEQALLESLSASAVAHTLPNSQPMQAKPKPSNATVVRIGGAQVEPSKPAPAIPKTTGGDAALLIRAKGNNAEVIQAVATDTEPVSVVGKRATDVVAERAKAATTKETKDPVAAKASTVAKAPAAEKPLPPPGVSALQTTNADLRRELHTKNQQLEALQKEVIELRSQLSMAEVEVSRLSSIMDAKTRASLGQYNIRPPARNEALPPVLEQREVRRPIAAGPVSDVRPPSPDAALQVATIAVPKAELRLGPGTNHSALMPLPRGSRLTVEMRQGEWLRVFAPSGERAWIHASLVTFGDGSVTGNSRSAVAVRGFDPNAEEEAFRRLQRGAGTK